jgi:hypothetical protein
MSAEPTRKSDTQTTGRTVKQKACSMRRHWEGGVRACSSTNPKALWPWRHWFMRPPPSLCRSPISLSSGSRKMRAGKQKTSGWTPSTWDLRLSPLLPAGDCCISVHYLWPDKNTLQQQAACFPSWSPHNVPESELRPLCSLAAYK